MIFPFKPPFLNGVFNSIIVINETEEGNIKNVAINGWCGVGSEESE